MRAALIDALAQRLARNGASAPRGLIKPGKAPLMERLAFLLSTGRDERNYAIGRYLDTRKNGGTFGTGLPRTGDYNNAYTNLDEPLDDLDYRSWR